MDCATTQSCRRSDCEHFEPEQGNEDIIFDFKLSFAPVVGTAMKMTSMVNMTRDLFRNRGDLMSCDFEKGRYISGCLLYRGTTQPCDVQRTIGKLKGLKDMTNAEGSPAIFKTVHSLSPAVYPTDCVFGDVSTAISK